MPKLVKKQSISLSFEEYECLLESINTYFLLNLDCCQTQFEKYDSFPDYLERTKIKKTLIMYLKICNKLDRPSRDIWRQNLITIEKYFLEEKNN